MSGLTIERTFQVRNGRTGSKRLGNKGPETPKGRLPRVTKLMALSIRFQQLIDDGVVSDYAELARAGHVTRARLSQIMNLLNLAPDIQEAILTLPRSNGRDAVSERDLRPIAGEVDWGRQIRMWEKSDPLSLNKNQ